MAGSYTKAARQLAGLANAHHPEPVLRTIRKHELRTLLAPRLAVPDIHVHSASLALRAAIGADSHNAPRWSGQMVWSVESLVPKRLTLPVHRMTLQLTIPEHGYAASVRPHFLETRRVAYPGGASDVRYVGYHIVVDGPGIVEMLVASFEEPRRCRRTQPSRPPP